MTNTNTLELPLFSKQYSEASAAKVSDTYQRLQKHHESKKRKFNLLKYLKVGGAVAVAAALGGLYKFDTSTHTQIVMEKVKPHEMVWNVVARAEADAGVKPDSGVDISPAVDAVRARYGTDLSTNEEIEVPVVIPR